MYLIYSLSANKIKVIPQTIIFDLAVLTVQNHENVISVLILLLIFTPHSVWLTSQNTECWLNISWRIRAETKLSFALLEPLNKKKSGLWDRFHFFSVPKINK